MPESRDRLRRPIDISTLLPNAGRRVNLIVDEPGLHLGLLGTPVRRRSHPNPAARGTAGGGLAVFRRGSRVAGRGRLRGSVRTPVTGGVRGGRGPLRTPLGQISDFDPPRGPLRTPLREVTHVARAFQRRRAIEPIETRQLEGELVERQQAVDTASPSVEVGQEISLETPAPVAFKNKPGLSPVSHVREILSRFADENIQGGWLTPQKKLLNSIEKVRDVWLHEQRRIESTPSAKRAEREKKVRVLMTMR